MILFTELYRLSENELHFNTRAKLVEQLKECHNLDVHIHCMKKGRFWRCNSSKTIKSWSQNWDKVETGTDRHTSLTNHTVWCFRLILLIIRI